jgi:hypothetical protein
MNVCAFNANQFDVAIVRLKRRSDFVKNRFHLLSSDFVPLIKKHLSCSTGSETR